MFKFQAVRRMFTYALLSVYVMSIPVSANAMSPGKNGGSGSGAGGNQEHLILAAQALLLALQAAPGLLNQAAQAAPDVFGQLAQYLLPAAQPPAPLQLPQQPQPLDAQQPQPLVATPARAAGVPRRPMPTPQGHVRVVQGHDFFGTPRTLGSRGIYLHTQEPVAFAPIDVNGQPMTEEQAFQLLQNHPQQDVLLDLLPPPAPNFEAPSPSHKQCEKYRYAGKTKGPMQKRFAAEVSAARKKDDRPSRHYQGLRGGYLRFGRAIFINPRDEDHWNIERALIRFVRANWGLGLNSNGGSKSKKRSLEPDLGSPDTELEEDDDLDFFLFDDCHEAKYQRKDEPDEDDEHDGGSSSDSTTYSPFGSQTQSSAQEVF